MIMYGCILFYLVSAPLQILWKSIGAGRTLGVLESFWKEFWIYFM